MDIGTFSKSKENLGNFDQLYRSNLLISLLQRMAGEIFFIFVSFCEINLFFRVLEIRSLHFFLVSRVINLRHGLLLERRRATLLRDASRWVLRRMGELNSSDSLSKGGTNERHNETGLCARIPISLLISSKIKFDYADRSIDRSLSALSIAKQCLPTLKLYISSFRANGKRSL